MNLLDSTEKMRQDRGLIEGLIDDPSRLGPDYQPIKRLSDGALVGYKATGRGQSGTELDNTLALLESAQSTGLVGRLDWAFRCLAFDQCLAQGVTAEVHLTPEPETFGSPCPPRLATSFGRGKRELKVAAEVHDYGLAHPQLESAMAEWRGWGWKTVLADVVDVADLALIRRLDVLRPDAIQIDLNRPARETHPRARDLLSWAQASGAEIHVLGVDTESRKELGLELGAVAGRGRLFGAPGTL